MVQTQLVRIFYIAHTMSYENNRKIDISYGFFFFFDRLFRMEYLP